MPTHLTVCLGVIRAQAGPVLQPSIGQSDRTVGGQGSASVTHIPVAERRRRELSAKPFIATDIRNNNIKRNIFDNKVQCSDRSGGAANKATTQAQTQPERPVLAGLAVSTRAYYYLYGSVVRCDACDECDKDMACQRAVAQAGSTPPERQSYGTGSSGAQPLNANYSDNNRCTDHTSGEQPGEQNQSCAVHSIAQLCNNVLALAFSAANQEIRRLASISIDYSGLHDFSDELFPSAHHSRAVTPDNDSLKEEHFVVSHYPTEDGSDQSSDFDEDKQILDICDIIDAEDPEEENEGYTEERSVSNLEKYFTQSLEEQLSDEDRRGTGLSRFSYTHYASMSPFSDNEEWVDDHNQPVDDHRQHQMEVQCSPEMDGHLSDGSTSSEEGLYSTPNFMPRAQSVYGNPLAYSLHTIVEESCEESDRHSSRPSTPADKSDAEVAANDSEKLFTFAVSHSQCAESHKRDSWCPSEDSVDSYTESEQALSSDFLAQEEYESPSRLEKYFMSGLLGSGAFDYPDDCEFADISDCDSSKPSLEVTQEVTQEVTSDTLSRTNEGTKSISECPTRAIDQPNCDTLEHKANEESVSSEVPQQVIAQQVSDKEGSEEDLEVSTPALRSLQDSPKDSISDLRESGEEKSISDECRDSPKLQEEEVQTFMNKLLSRMSGINRKSATADDKPSVSDSGQSEPDSALSGMNATDNPLPSLKSLEHQIARLMEAVSPARLSIGSESNSSYTSSSTIGSNNSDYGSDTLESDEEESKSSSTGDKRKSSRQTRSAANQSANSSDSTVSEETVYICKQLMSSLKKLTEIAFTDKSAETSVVTASSDMAKARMYIRDQIVALMHTVKSASPASTPPAIRDRKSTQTPFNHQSVVDSDQTGGDSSDCGDGSPKLSSSGGPKKKKPPSESGSETTCSASVSIPSYDDSDNTPTESEISHEMEELFALLDTTTKESTAPLNETNLSARPASDEDRASLKSWEARISMFGKREGVDAQPVDADSKSSASAQVIAPERTQTPSKVSEITINGKEVIRHKPPVQPQKASAVPATVPIGHKTVVKIDDNSAAGIRTESLSPIFDSLKDRSFSSDSVSSVQTVKARLQASQSEISSDGTQSTSRLTIDEVDDESEPNLTSGSLRKSLNAKDKASSEDNLLVANMTAMKPARVKPAINGCAPAKSAGNISELDSACNKSAFRDTGYYSFKSSEESIKSLDESSAVPSVRAHSTSTLPHQKRIKSETIVEVDEESSASESQTMPQNKRLFTPSHSSAAKVLSFSSPNIVDDVFNGSRGGSLPPNSRAPAPTLPHRSRSSFFSTSGVLRKLTALRGDDNSFRASPRRLRDRNRNASTGRDGLTKRTGGGGVPQISVSDYSESFSNRGSIGSSDQSTERHDSEDVETHVFAYHSRSQTSLSSFGARSESLSSVYSAAGGGRFGSVVVTGEILFSISYNYKAGAMEVYIRECRNLAPVDTKRMRSDPYVKVYLLPDRTKSGKRKTKVKKHTLNPVFEEVLKFYMTISEVETRELWISVWHSDIFGRNDFLGEVILPLGHEVFETPGLKWYPLQERLEVCENQTYKGDIFLALKYTPPDPSNRRSKKFPNQSAKGELHVMVKEAHNLMATRSNGTSDPFCKSYLLPDKSKAGKQKTQVIKKTCNPKWNHTFVFADVTIDELKERCLELTIWDYDKITSNDFLGGVHLGLGTGVYEGQPCDWMDSVGDEVSLWQQMLDRPNMWVYGELHLRPSMQTRRS